MRRVGITGWAAMILALTVLPGGCSNGLTGVEAPKLAELQSNSGQSRINSSNSSTLFPASANTKIAALAGRQPAKSGDRSPEALHRAELVARGDLPEGAANRRVSALSLNRSNIDDCPAALKAAKQGTGQLRHGISECQAAIVKGRPLAVRRLSKPGQPRRILLSFANADGTASHFEFIENRLVATY